ncbi:MAG: MFS transporter [Chloroflexota bacterium]
MQELAQCLGPLRLGGYRLLWLSSLTWYCARWMDVLVTSWVTLQLTNSAFDVALIGFFRAIPIMIFGTFAGAIADRFDRRYLVLATTVTNALAALAVGLLFLGGSLQYWHLVAANLVLGLAWSIEWPSRRAMIPDLAGKSLLLQAIIVDTISMNANRVVGPLAGGAILATLNAAECYFVLAALYAVGLLPLIPLRLPATRRPQRTASLSFIRDGLGYCYRNEVVRGVLLITVVMNAFFFPYAQLLSVMARDVLRVGPLELGLLGAGDGVGSLVGSLLVLTSTRLQRQGPAFVVGSLAMSVGLLAFAVSPVYIASMACLVLAGMAHSLFSTYQSAIILGETSDVLRARVMGVLTVAIGSSPIGMLFMGSLASAWGAPWALGLSGAIGAALVLASAANARKLLTYAPGPYRPPLPSAEPPSQAAPSRSTEETTTQRPHGG